MPKKAKFPIAGFRVLVVEDEPLIAHDIAECVTKAHCKVIGPAYTLEQALKLAHDILPDIAIVDILLRDKESYPLLEYLRTMGIPFLILTGCPIEALGTRRRDSEAVISKPFDVRRLINELHLLAERTFTLRRRPLGQDGDFVVSLFESVHNADMQNLDASLKHFSKHKYFGPLLKKHGRPDFVRYHGKMKIFSAIMRSIIYQQISGHAARAIHTRFIALFPKTGPTPELLLKLPTKKLRAAGLSVMKIEYMRDAARKFKDGTINEKRFPKMTSEEIVDHLVQIKGVGVWTAHMLLIFTLFRPDVLPTGDLAIRKGFQKVFGLRKEPTHAQMEKLANEWREHASVASWYLWRVADELKLKK